ncbi:MAG TPA: response regulator [Vicinamibacteria bacterium]|nr:response regulator [Vicinamibacteria bacterium]
MGIWGSNVVVVDDDFDTLELIRVLLRAQGAQVVGVSTPGEALTTVIGVMPEVLLVDIAMPGEDGLSLIRKVRTLSPEKGGRIPAATLTACPGVPERLAEWRRAGFQRHVPKPLAPDDLIAIVDELAGRVVERRTSVLLPAALPTDVRRERRREQRDVLLCGGDQLVERRG